MSKRERFNEVCSASEFGCGEVAALQLHSPAQCLDLGVVGGAGGDHNQVADVPLELVHHNVLGIVGTLGEREAGRRNRNRDISDLAVLIWPHLLDTT